MQFCFIYYLLLGFTHLHLPYGSSNLKLSGAKHPVFSLCYEFMLQASVWLNSKQVLEQYLH